MSEEGLLLVVVNSPILYFDVFLSSQASVVKMAQIGLMERLFPVLAILTLGIRYPHLRWEGKMPRLWLRPGLL